MKLQQVQEHQLKELTTWFGDEAKLAEWSGPGFRYPFTFETFKQDLKLDELKSFALVSETQELLAFGQYYNRINRCHLGRLVVNPAHRGKGVAAELLSQLCEKGMAELELVECSLFVLTHNDKAIKAYEKFGFAFAEYPEPIPLPNCSYMVKP